MHWHKADGNDAARDRDLDACRMESQAKYGSASSLGVMSPNDPRFGPTGPSQADLRMQESQSATACMRAKGYVLVPDGK